MFIKEKFFILPLLILNNKRKKYFKRYDVQFKLIDINALPCQKYLPILISNVNILELFRMFTPYLLSNRFILLTTALTLISHMRCLVTFSVVITILQQYKFNNKSTFNKQTFNK